MQFLLKEIDDLTKSTDMLGWFKLNSMFNFLIVNYQ